MKFSPEDAAKKEPSYTDEEIENLLDEGQQILADTDFSMDDFFAMKREELELEKRKLRLILGDDEE